MHSPTGFSRPRITSRGRSSFEPLVLRQIEPDVKHGQPLGCNIRQRPHQQAASTQSAKTGSIFSSLPPSLDRHMAILPPAMSASGAQLMVKILMGLAAVVVIAAGGFFGFEFYTQHRIEGDVEAAFAQIRAGGGKASHGKVSFD